MRAVVSSGTTRYSQTQACLRLVACMGDFVQSLKQVAKGKTGPHSALSIMKYITKKESIFNDATLCKMSYG